MTTADVATPNVEELTGNDQQAWNAFVDAHPDGGFFHRAEWMQVARDGLGHRPRFLFAHVNGTVTGVLPLVHQQSWLFGDALTSLAPCTYGGVLAADPVSQEALLAAARAMAQELRVDHLELRNRNRLSGDWLTKELYVNFSKPIFDDDDENLRAIPRKQRAMVRKGIKAGLRSEWSDDSAAIFDIYSASVRNLGTPVLGRKYFAALSQAFGSSCRTLDILHENQKVASVLSFFYKDQVLPYYGGGTVKARNTKANDFMYWELMRRSAQQGVRVFDYGRSKKDSGSFRFKVHWGFEPEQLYYQYELVRAHEMPNLSPNNPKYRLLIATWQRMPLGLTRLMGPPIARHLT